MIEIIISHKKVKNKNQTNKTEFLQAVKHKRKKKSHKYTETKIMQQKNYFTFKKKGI